jgi:hypothetical protein
MTKHEQLSYKGGESSNHHLDQLCTLLTITATTINHRRGDDHNLELPTQEEHL